jgi:hypothetical protein
MPPRCPARNLGAFLALAAGLLALPACSGSKDPREALAYGQTVRGKVTYGGQPVPYGFVLFYSHDKSKDVKDGSFTPSAVGPIVEGRYEVPNAPLGHVAVCLATDPDLDPGALTRPMKPGEKGGAPDKGGPPGLPPMPHTPPGGKVGMPEGPPIPPPPGDPGGSGPMPPKPPPGMKLPQGLGNPLTKGLSDAQRQALRDIHARFGEFGRSPLAFEVKEGDNTFDINLPK